jgi:hypothetical protein
MSARFDKRLGSGDFEIVRSDFARTREYFKSLVAPASPVELQRLPNQDGYRALLVGDHGDRVRSQGVPRLVSHAELITSSEFGEAAFRTL